MMVPSAMDIAVRSLVAMNGASKCASTAAARRVRDENLRGVGRNSLQHLVQRRARAAGTAMSGP